MTKDNGVIPYACKERTRVEGPWEFGTKPMGYNVATDWEEIRTLAKQGLLDQIPAEIYVRHY